MILKRLFCKHRNRLPTKELWSYFGREHITYVCVDCGKQFY